MISIRTKSKEAKDNENLVAVSSIKDFMADTPDGLEAFWPLDFSNEGYKTEYVVGRIGYKQAGLVKSLRVQAEIKNDSSHYVVAVDFDYDGEYLDVGLESLYKEKGKNGNKFTAQLIEKFKNFVTEYDKMAGNEKTNVSTIRIHAKSGYHKKTEQSMWGGYVWANHGFDFDRRLAGEELAFMKKSFKTFCAGKKIVVEDKDLKKLTKPCHFAAFDCGIRLENEEGKIVHVGKEFMSTQSWHGAWNINDKNSVQEQYAKEYNNFEMPIATRRKNALMSLDSSYVKMLKKYAKQDKKGTKQAKSDEEIARNRKSFAEKLKSVRAKLKKAVSR